MTDENQTPALPAARVATRPGTSEVAEKRRRIYQTHLLLFLAVGVALVAADLYTSPGLQWAHFPLVPWGLVFIMHTVGLKSRGYSFVEMLVPPRTKPIREVYTVPLDYEVVRARQLRDGVTNAAAALRAKDAALADRAVAAADTLVSAIEEVVASTRSGKYTQQEQAEKLLPEARAGLEALDELHEGILRIEVLEASPETIPIDPLEQRAQALRALA